LTNKTSVDKRKIDGFTFPVALVSIHYCCIYDASSQWNSILDVGIQNSMSYIMMGLKHREEKGFHQSNAMMVNLETKSDA
jgi:hypothetical protein